MLWSRTGKLIIISIALLIAAASAQAYLKDLGVGARPLGMGGAYVAAADDGNAILWNAAGLAQIKRHEITSMYSSLYKGLDGTLYNEETDSLGYHFIGYVYPAGRGSFGFSWSTFQSHFYDESTFCISYGRKLKKRLYAGLSLKRPGWKIEGNEYTRLDKDIPDDGTSRKGITFDLSALYYTRDGLSLGFSAENLLPTDVGLTTEENIPINLRGGIAYRVDNPGNLSIDLLSALDFTYRVEDKANIHMGMEGWLFGGTLGARAGWNLTSATFGLSCRAIRKWLELQIDYAFVYPISIQETYGSHRMSMSLRF
ncbi:hypothetical protein ACFL6S_17370 [Candidatus Poribacteria bacterium]